MARELRTACERELAADEKLVAFCTPDLDDALHFCPGLLVLTDRRLIALSLRESRCEVQSWPLSGSQSLRTKEFGSLGELDLVTPDALVARWHFTTGGVKAAQRFVRRFETLLSGQAEIEDDDDAEPTDEGRSEDEDETLASTVSLFRLWRFAKRHVVMIAVGFLLTLAVTGSELIPLSLTKPLLDDILVPFQNELESLPDKEQDAVGHDQGLQKLQAQYRPRFRRVPWYLAGLALAAVVGAILAFVQGWLSNRVSESINADLRNATYEHLMKLSLDFFGDKRTGELISRVSSDTDRICLFLSDSIVDFITNSLTIVGTAAMLTWIDPLLGITTLLTFPLIGGLIYWVREHLKAGFSRSYRAWDAMTSILADTIPGIRVVKAFAQESREIERFRQSNQRIFRLNSRVNAVWSFFWPLVAMLNQLGLVVIWALGAARLHNHQITVGVLGVFVAAIGRLYSRLESMTRMFTTLQRAATSTHRLFEILDRVPAVRDPENPIHPGRLEGRIELRDLTFRYGNRTIIHNLNLTVEPGEMIGIVGETGSGKTTLVNLFCRFFDPTEGAIFVDGVDIRSFAVSEYRQNIGIVLQEPFLFFGTIAENIAYGKPEATHAEILNAARAAQVHNFVLQRPLSYDSPVGERGQSLSGGERQRISIARAILIDPRILILDEATSAVDTKTEREIQRAFDNLVQGRTTIAIAHRLSTLQRANRILVLDRGRIVEMGQHDELLAKGGAYARLYRAQLEARPADAT